MSSYRVTNQVVLNLLLTSKRRLRFSIGSLYFNATFFCQQEVGNYLMGQPVLKLDFCFNVN